jgi:dihydrodipicolinate synthase/N-acetylneuraminate lyase
MKDFGVLVPIVTPCTLAGELDMDGLKAVCDDMTGAGCKGVFVTSSTGRGPWFNRNDKVKICRCVADQVSAQVSVFAGCMAAGLPDMLENARIMADAGANMAVVTGPSYFNYSQAEIEAIFLKFADDSPVPVMIYDIPGFAGVKLDAGMVARLAKHENIAGLKDSSGDFDNFKKVLSILSDTTDFYVMQGKENLLADSLLAGASGLVIGFLNINPSPFIVLYKAVKSKNIKSAVYIQDRITTAYEIVMKCFERRPETSTLLHILNFCLKKRRICDNILLSHEGECPCWLADEAAKVLEICQSIDHR